MISSLQTVFRKQASEKAAKQSQRFFKTGKGQYGYGDIFLGINTPTIRKFAKQYVEIELNQTQTLIKSKFHEERALGLLILVGKFGKAKTEAEKEKYYQVYLAHFEFINNWDLVDVTCPHLVGKHLMDKDRSILYEWAKSEQLWTKRIAMVTTWWFIRKNDLKDVFPIAKILLQDEHDLIHKAVGWMLREAAKKDFLLAESFLKKHYPHMPRTMLRYAIERYPEAKRQKFLKGKV